MLSLIGAVARLGFLNAKIFDTLLPAYLADDAYDLVILDDPSLAVHLSLLSQVIQGRT